MRMNTLPAELKFSCSALSNYNGHDLKASKPDENGCYEVVFHREQYRGAKACDKNCRNHGNCEWCKNNRMYRSNRLEEKIKFDLANKE